MAIFNTVATTSPAPAISGADVLPRPRRGPRGSALGAARRSATPRRGGADAGSAALRHDAGDGARDVSDEVHGDLAQGGVYIYIGRYRIIYI